MTKVDLAYRALKKLYPKLTQDAKTSLREMVAAVGNARDKVVADFAWQAWSNDLIEDMVWEGCISTYEQLSPTKDTRTNRWYLQLPFKPLVLPKNMGIYQITPCNNTFEYYQVPSTFNSLFNGSASKELEGNTGYWLSGDRIYFTAKQTEETLLDVHSISSSEDIADDDYFPFPPNLELDIINMAVQEYVLTKDIPEDLSDNNLADS